MQRNRVLMNMFIYIMSWLFIDTARDLSLQSPKINLKPYFLKASAEVLV